MNIEILEIAALFASTISAVATLYMALQIAIFRRTYENESNAQKMQRTLDAVQLSSSIRKTMSEVVRRYDRSDGELSFSSYDPEFVDDIFVALSALETLATGILSNVYDEEIAYTRLGDSILIFYHAIRRFVYKSREMNSAESLYVQLDQLVRRWSDKGKRYSFHSRS